MTDIEDYFDAWSGVYDAELSAREDADVRFYCEEALAADGAVLELGCGTGRIYLALLEQGVDAYGLDISAEMLSKLRSKAANRGLTPSVTHADVAEFSYDRTFDRVFAPADVFLYNLTIDDQLATLANVRDVLAPGGEFVCSYFTPNVDSMCELYGEELSSTVTIDGEQHTVRSKIEFADEPNRIIRIEKAIEAQDETTQIETEMDCKLLPKREMELLLGRAGFDAYEVSGGFDGEPLTADSDRMVWRARRD